MDRTRRKKQEEKRGDGIKILWIDKYYITIAMRGKNIRKGKMKNKNATTRQLNLARNMKSLKGQEPPSSFVASLQLSLALPA